MQSASLVNGAPTAGNPENPVSVTVVAGENTQVDFGNYCTCTIKPYPTNYWLGSCGQTKLDDGTGMNPEFKLLNDANLRSAGGWAVQPEPDDDDRVGATTPSSARG